MAEAGMIEDSPARSPWACDNTYARSRFIVKRLKRMRTKARSMHDPVSGTYTNSFCYTPSDSTDAASSTSYESIPKAGTPGKATRPEAIYETPRQVEQVSRRNQRLIRAEKVDFEEAEYTEPLDSCYTLSRSRASKSVETMSGKENVEEADNKSDKEVDAVSFSSADYFEYNFYEERDDGMHLLEAIERALPKECSLKKRLFCPYSVTMYRTLLRLNQLPRAVSNTQVHRRSLSLKNVSAYIESELLRLKVELMVQQAHVEQARRALEVSMMNRANIREHLEAEKTLLLATIRQTTVQEETQKWLRLQYLQDVFVEEESGCAIVKGLTITLDNIQHWSSYYFILVAVERDSVKGTELSTPISGWVHFTTHLHFSNLRPDFRITFYLYAITIKDPKFKFFHRSNERLNFLGRSSKPKWRNSLVEGLEHNFKLIGITEVMSPDFTKSNLVLTTMVPHLSSHLAVKLQGAVYLDTRHAGFLDIRYTTDGEHGVWCRYWFRLSGMELLGWNYPSQVNNQEPAHQIPLTQCTSAEVTAVSRFTCVRPHTFSMELNQQQVLCSADSLGDLEAWCHHINTILRASRLWNL